LNQELAMGKQDGVPAQQQHRALRSNSQMLGTATQERENTSEAEDHINVQPPRPSKSMSVRFQTSPL